MTIPNYLTLGRIALIPLFVLVFYLPGEWTFLVSTAIFGLAAATDWLDGYLARKWNLSTPFGMFLDPVADKLLVATALVLLVHRDNTLLVTLPAVIIIGREIAVSALREWMAQIGKNASVAVSWVGKLKTTLQMIAIIGLLLFNSQTQPLLHNIGVLCLIFAAGLTIWSMVQYLKIGWVYMAPHAKNDGSD